MKVPFWANRQTQSRKNRLMQRSGDPDSLTFSQRASRHSNVCYMYVEGSFERKDVGSSIRICKLTHVPISSELLGDEYLHDIDSEGLIVTIHDDGIISWRTYL